MKLPSPLLRKRWQSEDVPLGPAEKVIDTCGNDVAVVDNVDHPFLAELERIGAPDAVKNIYRRDIRIKHRVATEAWSVGADLSKAYRSWEQFIGTR
jgi:hypothetical protein